MRRREVEIGMKVRIKKLLSGYHYSKEILDTVGKTGKVVSDEDDCFPHKDAATIVVSFGRGRRSILYNHKELKEVK